MTDSQVCLHEVAEAIKSLELLIEYVERNKRLEWCWGIDISACKSKLEFYQDSLVDVTTALDPINW